MKAYRTGKEDQRSDLVMRKQPGYYPGYSTLRQQNFWDETTRAVVIKRVSATPPIRFFAPEEVALLEAVVNRILPQDDRAPEIRIPIVPFIDERLYGNTINGFRYEDMPTDRDAYKLGLHAIEVMAQERFKMPFLELSTFPRELILKSLHDGKPDPEVAVWKQMPVGRFWTLIVEDCVSAYYSHPWAWDEIGFGGPAYPRGYMRLENGLPEPWEENEDRYVWTAPAETASDLDLKPKTRVGNSTLLEGTHSDMSVAASDQSKKV